MKNLNKYIFTLCLLISCFIFSNKVYAVTLNVWGSDNYENLGVTGATVVNQKPHPNCLNGAKAQMIGTGNSAGMSICSFNTMNGELIPEWGVNYSEENKEVNDKKYTYIKSTDYTIARVDLFYECDKNNDNCSWSINKTLDNKTIIYPGMNLVYDVIDKVVEDSPDTFITEIVVEKANYMDYTNSNTQNLIKNFAPTNFEIYKHEDSDRGWTSVASMNSEGDYVKENDIKYGQYQYTIDIKKLLATNNCNNNNTGLGYNGTMYDFLYKQDKGNKQWEFHYLIPIKTTVTRVKVVKKDDICIKDSSIMTSNEKDACCNYPKIIKDGKTFKELNPNLCPKNCEEIREENNKQEYLSKNCCITDSTNSPEEWCCENEEYLNNNKTKCCTKEKETGYKSLYFPNSLSEKFDEVCCKDKEFFDNGEYKNRCCEREKETIFKGIYFPDIYAFRYDEKCENPTDTKFDCKNESDFKKNKTFCCAREKANNKTGKYIPNNLNYETAECEPKSSENEKDNCKNSDRYFEGHILTCCRSNSYPSGKENRCEEINPTDNLNCKYYESTVIGNPIDEYKIGNYFEGKINETIKYKINDNEKDNAIKIESGTGFEYPIEVTHIITTNITGDTTMANTKKIDAENIINSINATISVINTEITDYVKNISLLEYSFNINEAKNLMIIKDVETIKELKKTITYNYEEKNLEFGIWKKETDSINTAEIITEVKITYKIVLPHAYINKNTRNTEYFSDLQKTDDYKRNYYYGGNKYYTEVSDDTKYRNFNITINNELSKLTNLEGNKFTCGYITYPCLNRDICPNKTGEIKEDNGYFYRRISLDKPFPNNRTPGKNWNEVKDGKTFANYYIIESKEDAYKEPMYEIDLTSDLIKKIRDYNKKSNYLDWNMAGTKCTESNKNECESTSKFLSGNTDTNGSGLDASFMSNKVKFWGTDSNDNKRKQKYGEDKVIVEESE